MAQTKNAIALEQWKLVEKRCYILMSSAGAGLGYAIAVTERLDNTHDTRVFLASVLLFALSFMFGLIEISNLKRLMNTNVRILSAVQEANSHGLGESSVLKMAIDEGVEDVNKRLNLWHGLQIASLFGGALIYVTLKVDFELMMRQP